MWRLYTDDKAGEEDWYIKPNVYVFYLLLEPIPADRQEQRLDRRTKYPPTGNRRIPNASL